MYKSNKHKLTQGVLQLHGKKDDTSYISGRVVLLDYKNTTVQCDLNTYQSANNECQLHSKNEILFTEILIGRQ